MSAAIPGGRSEAVKFGCYFKDPAAVSLLAPLVALFAQRLIEAKGGSGGGGKTELLVDVLEFKALNGWFFDVSSSTADGAILLRLRPFDEGNAEAQETADGVTEVAVVDHRPRM